MATSFLIVCLCAIWDKRNANNTDSIPARMGLLLAGLFMVAAPYTGCSINTARTLAPAVYNNVWKDHWVSTYLEEDVFTICNMYNIHIYLHIHLYCIFYHLDLLGCSKRISSSLIFLILVLLYSSRIERFIKRKKRY